jgi:cell division protein FtsQ
MTPENRRVAPPPPEEAPRPVAADGGPRQAPARTLGSVFRAIVGVVLVVGASGAVAWVARRHVLHSARFEVAAIDVAGNVQRPAAAIVAESGLALGSNVFGADLSAARGRILAADPWIADATLARRLPSKIQIQVTERQAACLVAMGDTYLATAQGEPFKKVEPEDAVDLPLVTGLRAEQFAEDREGGLRTVRRAMDLAAEYQRGSLARRAPLEEVHVEPDGAFSLIVGRSALQLVLGVPPFRRKLDQATRVVAELDRRGAKADAIMLDNDSRPERVVVRMR